MVPLIPRFRNPYPFDSFIFKCIIETMATYLDIIKETQEAVETITGYYFVNSDWLWEALQAAGSDVTMIGSKSIPEGNKRLAVVGDTILNQALIDSWYVSYESRGMTPCSCEPPVSV